MTAVVLATCADLPSGDEDADALGSALAARGVEARWQPWTDPSAAWADALVVIRSTWDYTADRDAFLAWARGVPRLANPSDVVEWNSDKTYLRDLARAGIPIVPTEWVEPGRSVALPTAGEFVVKPSVGAGSRGAGRFATGSEQAARAHAAHLHDAGRVVLIQPYLTEVDVTGETALIYLDGTFSHAVVKAAMLPEGAVNPIGLTGEGSLFVEERIRGHHASADELAVGERVLARLRERFGGALLYTRVDLLPSAHGPVVVEVELVEPSLFLGFADGAADRFAAAIARRARAKSDKKR